MPVQYSFKLRTAELLDLAAWLIVVKLLFLPLVSVFVGPLLGLSSLYYY